MWLHKTRLKSASSLDSISSVKLGVSAAQRPDRTPRLTRTFSVPRTHTKLAEKATVWNSSLGLFLDVFNNSRKRLYLSDD